MILFKSNIKLTLSKSIIKNFIIIVNITESKVARILKKRNLTISNYPNKNKT